MPRANTRTGANPRGVAITAPRPKPTINDHAARTLATGNNPRGVAIAQHPAGGQTVHDAVRAVFKHQNPVGQARILQGIKAGKADRATANAVREAVGQMSGPDRLAMMQHFVGSNHASIDADLKGLGRIFNPLRALREPVAPGGVARIIPSGLANSAVTAADQGLTNLAKHGRGDTQSGGYAAITNHIINKNNLATGAEIGLNMAKDAISTPAGTLSTLGTVGKDLVTQGPKKALSDFTHPYGQMIADPLHFVPAHPLDSYWMAVAPIHGVTRAAAGAARATGHAGGWASTTREGVHLTGNMTRERPRASPYPLIKAGQVLVEKKHYRRGPTGRLEYRSPSARAHQVANATSNIIGVNERLRSANRDATAAESRRSVIPGNSRVGRAAASAAHGAKTALKYNPDATAIKGADVLSLIADTTIRRPDTFKQDLSKYIRKVSANRPNLLDHPKLLAEHDATVKALKAAEGRDYTPGQINRLFKAAESYHAGYSPVEAQAHEFGHFGDRTKDALLKRTLYHYANNHMDAPFDPTLGLVRAGTKSEVRGLVQSLRSDVRQLEQGKPSTADNAKAAELRATIQRAWDQRIVPLRTQEIVNHIHGPEGTGGRMPTFTSDAPKRGSAFYVSNERRPLPQNARNTLFAYTHGLIDPSHNALLEQHVRMQGIVDAYKGQNRLVDQMVLMRPDGKAWSSFQNAENDAEPGYVPFALSQPFHAQAMLEKSLEGTNPATIHDEVAARGLDLTGRTHDQGQGRWGLIDRAVLKRVEEHKAQIQSHPGQRAIKAFNNQARSVALSTSPKHAPGIIQENLLRDAANGNGLLSWIAGQRVIGRAKALNPELGHEGSVALRGGGFAGATKTMMTHQTSDHFWGTTLYKPLKTYEDFMKAPGARQARTLWRAWAHLMIGGMKHFVAQQHETAAVGKAALKDFAAEHGPLMKTWRLQGQMLDDAAKGLFDPAKLRQLRAETERMNGKWSDLPPTMQHALMYTPFGLWYVNSLKWLMRAPIDRPLQTGALAAATVGTQKEREAMGLDMFGKGALPLYMQGGVPFGGSILGQNYYSPFGALNDPVATAGSLLVPWLVPLINGAQGNSTFGKPLTSPGNPKGHTAPHGFMQEAVQRAAYIGNSLLDLVVPAYLKATQVAEGGASAYDSSTLVNPQTKTPGQGPLAGLKKAVTPIREYHPKASAQAASNKYSIPKDATNASGGQWNVVHSNPKGTGASGTTWKVAGSSLGSETIPKDPSAAAKLVLSLPLDQRPAYMAKLSPHEHAQVEHLLAQAPRGLPGLRSAPQSRTAHPGIAFGDKGLTLAHPGDRERTKRTYDIRPRPPSVVRA